MDKKDIISFFDEFAHSWDNMNHHNSQVIEAILDNAQIKENTKVLDIACGTGVLFPYYLSRKADVVGIDFSEEMIKNAKTKFPEINVICADAEAFSFNEKFDVIMIYNAFPHFPEPLKIIENLSKLLNKNGRISIAHGASREEIQKCHQGSAKKISLDLPEITEIKKMLEKDFEIDILISDDKMYQISGTKKIIGD